MISALIELIRNYIAGVPDPTAVKPFLVKSGEAGTTSTAKCADFWPWDQQPWDSLP